jgi:hypothetical protein
MGCRSGRGLSPIWERPFGAAPGFEFPKTELLGSSGVLPGIGAKKGQTLTINSPFSGHFEAWGIYERSFNAGGFETERPRCTA